MEGGDEIGDRIVRAQVRDGRVRLVADHVLVGPRERAELMVNAIGLDAPVAE